MKELGLAIEGGLLLGCIWVLLVIALAVLTCNIIRQWHIWRKKRKATVLTLLACAAIIVGGTKPSMRSVQFPRTDMEIAYLMDAGSYVSNDFVHVEFNTVLIPQDAPVTLAYWPNESTNEEDFVEYFTAQLADWPRPLDFEFENAISNRWYCYTTWTPGPAVHTNGVWQQTWMTDRRDGQFIIPLRTAIIYDGEQIAPPKIKAEGGNDDE